MTDVRLQELYQRALATRDGGPRDGCVTPEAMLALVRREGAEEARLATLDHVMACDDCRREFDLLRAIEAAGAQAAGGAAARPTRPSTLPLRRVVPLALAASLLVAVGIGVRGRFGEPEAPDTMRGESGAITLISPAATSVAVDAPLTFVWRRDPTARRYVLEVLDAGGGVVLSEGTSDTTITVRDAGRLAPGTDYRWWVRAVSDGGAEGTSAMRPLRIRSR